MFDKLECGSDSKSGIEFFTRASEALRLAGANDSEIAALRLPALVANDLIAISMQVAEAWSDLTTKLQQRISEEE